MAFVVACNKWLQPTAKTVTCFAKKPAKQPPFFAAAEPGVRQVAKVMERYKYNIFGREVLIERSHNCWATFYQGSEGKRRNAGIFVPPEITEAELTQFLSDLRHEWASERHPSVVRLSESK